VQRYLCGSCGRSFSRDGPHKGKHIGLDIRQEVIERNVGGGSSRRAISRGLGIGLGTVSRILTEAGRSAKDSLQVARELKPMWRGTLVVDGKGIKIKGESYCYLVAQDTSGDVVHGKLAWDEDKRSLRRFFEEIRDDLEYPLKGIVSDMDDATLWAAQEVFGDVPHQYCLAHALRLVDDKTGYAAEPVG